MLLLVLWNEPAHAPNLSSNNVLEQHYPSPENDTLTIIGVGDIMLGTNFPNTSYLPPDSAKYLLTNVSPILQNADITFGNVEGTFLDSGGKAKRCSDPSICYAFRQPTPFARELQRAGFDMVSIANNHIFDFGEFGAYSTLQTLQQLNLAPAGIEGAFFSVVERKGIRIGLCAFATSGGTMLINDIFNAQKYIKQIDSTVDVLIVSFHGGAEGDKADRVPKTEEFFLGDSRGDVMAFARAAVDAGADIVFGHGPHVIRAAELYNEKFIIYSLGNFCTYARFNLKGKRAFAPIVKLFVHPDGRFIKAEVFSALQEGEGIPVPDPQANAYKELQRLTELDFPTTPLEFSAEGVISSKKNLRIEK